MIPIVCDALEPYIGTWVADTVTTEVPSGAFEMGERTWSGTVLSSAQDGNRYKARIVGGKGRLSSALPAKNYQPAALATVAADIIRACGETAGVIDASARVGYYERASGTAGDALTELCNAGGLVWWVSRDGLVNVAKQRPTNSAVDTDKTQQTGADIDGSVTLNVVTADDVQPGMLAAGSAIRAMYWRLTSGSLLVECSPVQPTVPDSRGAAFYLKTYSARVDKQNADGSVDVIADALFSLKSVPLLSGLPGSAVTVKGGEMVAVGFLGGNRSTPYAMGFAQLVAAASALALVGDTVEIVLPPFAFVGTVGGAPATGVMNAVIPKTLGQVIGPGSARTKSQ